MTVKLNIDGRDYEVRKDLNLLRACGSVGIKVPHFCYHPGLGPDGNCRMCQVELVTERGRQLVISCNIPVRDGMIVETQSEKAKRVRAGVEEFLLLNHPLDCPICDKAGECKLQDYYMEHDLQDSFMEFTRHKKRKATVLGKTLVLDQERCVLCDRCVRFLRDIAGREELYIAGRGHGAYLTAFPGMEVTSPYSLNTVDLCPVGALTSRDFRFNSPAWFLKKTPSVCTTCSRGCSVVLDHRDGKIFRIRPRHNPEVNGYWMCDEGRLNYKFVNEGRAGAHLVKKQNSAVEVTYEEALEAVLKLIVGRGTGSSPGKNIVLLVSATCTLEEMFLMKRLALEHLGDALLCSVLHVPDGEEDSLLKRADGHCNLKSAELLGLSIIDMKESSGEAGGAQIKQKLGNSGIILACGFDYDVTPVLDDVFSHASAAIVLAACMTHPAERADAVIAGMTFAEKEGIIVNFQQRAQQLHPANVGNNFVPEGFDLQPAGRSQWKVLSELLERISPGSGFADIKSVRKAISSEEGAFKNAGLENLPTTGMTIGRPKNEES